MLSSIHCILSVPPNPEAHPPWDVPLLLQGFSSPAASSLAFPFLCQQLSSPYPPLFPHLFWVPVGRKGAGPGIRVSTQWLAQNSEVRKRETSTPFIATSLVKTALNCFMSTEVPVKFCTGRQTGISLNRRGRK